MFDQREDAADESRWALAYGIYCALSTKCNLLNNLIHLKSD